MNIRIKLLGTVALVLGMIAGCAGGDGGASAGRSVLATQSVGGSYHALGSGLASMVTDRTDVGMTVQPYSGPNAWIPELDDNTIQFGLGSVIDAGWAYEGGPGFEKAYSNVRLVLEGNQLAFWGLVVPEKSEIRSLTELAGKKVGSEYGGNFVASQLVEAELASVGLDWDDVVAVPQPEQFAGVEALQNGEVDSTSGLVPTTPSVMEAAQAMGGIRNLPFGDYEPSDLADGVPDEAQRILDEYAPGATLMVIEAGAGANNEDTVDMAYALHMLSTAEAPEEMVYEVLEAIWNHHEDFGNAHPWAQQWTRETMPTQNFTAPFHDGAVSFYKDQGVWTDAHEQRQEELLAQS